MRVMTVIALLTDFGAADGYPGIMKGVIWGLAPGVPIADLTHEIAPQDVRAGALALERAAPYFPAGTIFLAVVDPGVGTARRPLAARLGGAFFVGPDNGLCTPLLARAEAAGGAVHFVHLDQPRAWLPTVSRTFHGRDIFAPVAARLALGAALDELGTRIDDPARLILPQPRRLAGGWRGEVIHSDRFGNLTTNLRREHLADCPQPVIVCGGVRITRLAETYGEGAPGELLALIDSAGYLSLSAVNGSAARALGVAVGAEALLTPG